MNKIYDIAIIGAGPAGIATACEAVILGIKDILLFEKSDNHSDTIKDIKNNIFILCMVKFFKARFY